MSISPGPSFPKPKSLYLNLALTFIGSTTYPLSEKIVNILAPLVGNTEFHVHNSNDFVKFIKDLRLEYDEILVSFEAVSLFANVPTTLTVEIVKKRLTECDEFQERTNWSIQDVFEGLDLCMQSSYFTFRGKYFKQIFGTPMGSPMSPILANLVMEDIQNEAKTEFHHPPKVWKHYVDNTFVVIKRKYLKQFFNLLNSIQPTVQFKQETENDGALAFLDVKLTRESTGCLDYTVRRKPTHTQTDTSTFDQTILYNTQKRLLKHCYAEQNFRLQMKPTTKKRWIAFNQPSRTMVIRLHWRLDHKIAQYQETDLQWCYRIVMGYRKHCKDVWGIIKSNRILNRCEQLVTSYKMEKILSTLLIVKARYIAYGVVTANKSTLAKQKGHWTHARQNTSTI